MQQEIQDNEEWLMSETLCDTCIEKVVGCSHFYDDEECLKKRRHFSKTFIEKVNEATCLREVANVSSEIIKEILEK